MTSIFKSLVLPVLASLGLLGVFGLGGNFVGVTRVTVPLERPSVDFTVVKDRVDARDVWLDRGGCERGEGWQLIVELPAWKPVPTTWQFQRAGVDVCGAPRFEFNAVSRKADAVARALHGATLLAFMALLAVAVLVVYVRVGVPAGLPEPNFRPRLLWGVGAAVMLVLAGRMAVALDTATWGGGLTVISLPNLVIAAVIIPIVEELAFRAWLIEYAKHVLGAVGAACFSAGVFAVVHVPADIVHFGYYFVAGLIFAAVWARTRSVGTCVLAHGGFNALLLVS